MKKLFILLLKVISIYFVIRFLIGALNIGHSFSYTINKYYINETYFSKTKNFYITITGEENSYSLKLYTNKKNNTFIVKNVKEYNGDKYTCVRIELKKYDSDIICKDDNYQYEYSSIIGKDKTLDEIVNNNYIEKEEYVTKDFLNIYENNIEDSIYVSNYRGYYYIKENLDYKKFNNILFKNDWYSKKEIRYKNYVLIADYTKATDFNNFYLVNLKNGKNYKIEGEYDISYDLLYQGGYNNSIYLIDKYNKKQYEVDLLKKEVNYIGNSKIGAFHLINNKLQSININDIINNDLTFTNKYEENKEYVFNGYSLYFVKENNLYNCFVIDDNDKENVKYTFSSSDLENISILSDRIYYVRDNNLYLYKSGIGSKKVLESVELISNNNFNYHVIEKGL